MLVSVIIPAYNSSPYVEAAIQSILDQTVRDLEVIVVDDASTDDTAGVVARIAKLDGRVRLIRRNEPSGRPARPRNEGLRAASGKYVAFLDADDLSLPERLETSLDAIASTGRRFVFTDYRRFHEATGEREKDTALAGFRFLEHAEGYLDAHSDSVFIARDNFVGFLLAKMPVVGPQTVLAERSLLLDEEYLFDEALVCGEDQDLWLRLATRTQFVFVNQALTLLRKHSSSLTTTQHVRTVEDVATVRRWNLERLRHRLSSSEVQLTRLSIAAGLLDVGYARWVEGNGRAARRAFRDSWHASPSLMAVTGYAKSFVPRATAVRLTSRVNARS